MDTILKDTDLQPGLRRALDRAAAVERAVGVRVVTMKGGYRLQSIQPVKSDAGAPAGYRRKGPVHLGVMGHLNLKLDD